MRQKKTHTHKHTAYERWQKKDKREEKKKRMLENVITLRICQLWEITRKHIHTSTSIASGKTSGIDACLLLIAQLPWEGLNIYTKYRRGSRLLSLHIHNRFFFFCAVAFATLSFSLTLRTSSFAILVFVNSCVRALNGGCVITHTPTHSQHNRDAGN